MGDKALAYVCRGNSAFSKKLYNILARGQGNIVFSPLSAHAILSLMQQGAAGEPAKCMANTLEVSDINLAAMGYQSLMEMLNSIDNVTFHIANKIFVHSQCVLKENFKVTANEYFLTEIERIAFVPDNDSAAEKINQWIEHKTNKKIKNVIQPDDLTLNTRLILINAIYFKGNWLKQFNPEFTSRDKFYLNDTDSIDCDMMYAEDGFFYGVDLDLDAQIIKLLYKNTSLSLIIILPRSKTGIHDLEKKLATKDLRDINRRLHYADVILSLPRFKVETKIELNDPLRELGLDIIFQNQVSFPNVLHSAAPLHVSKIIQKAFIEVSEVGTEAAAATGKSLFYLSICSYLLKMISDMTTSVDGSVEEHIFDANHPFAFSVCYHIEENVLPVFFGTLKTLT
ncbi:serine protease inhibitor serpin [Holotrichia oblita]|uniref:Serine protease inhibitor serpin n=1 Tax=Holotrichia oblita TaxID=644536 RepID=A0ACB9T729_HOLOL|nr:serine protease inhibitor serpin [Holotrichia oblita]